MKTKNVTYQPANTPWYNRPVINLGGALKGFFLAAVIGIILFIPASLFIESKILWVLWIIFSMISVIFGARYFAPRNSHNQISWWSLPYRESKDVEKYLQFDIFLPDSTNVKQLLAYMVLISLIILYIFFNFNRLA